MNSTSQRSEELIQTRQTRPSFGARVLPSQPDWNGGYNCLPRGGSRAPKPLHPPGVTELSSPQAAAAQPPRFAPRGSSSRLPDLINLGSGQDRMQTAGRCGDPHPPEFAPWSGKPIVRRGVDSIWRATSPPSASDMFNKFREGALLISQHLNCNPDACRVSTRPTPRLAEPNTSDTHAKCQ